MNKVKIICYLISILLLALCLFGCGSSEVNKYITEPETAESVVTVENITENENTEANAESNTESSEIKSLVTIEREDGDLEIITALPQLESQSEDTTEKQTEAAAQQATESVDEETQPQDTSKETYIVLPFVPAQ